ncbi:hypothetical protein HYX11_01650 [Candidatus Woesearchaeota archaeon]|nr:hypothetical protein [Candidatus Woesearchaeota archaeon]
MVPKKMYQLSRQELENVLHQAIAKAEREQERNRQTLADNIYQTLPGTDNHPDNTSEQIDDNLVDLVFQALDQLDPTVKKHLEEALLARHYNINYTSPTSEGNLVLLKNNPSELEQTVKEFSKKIFNWSIRKNFSYSSFGPVHNQLKTTQKSVEILVYAGILEKDDVQIYLAALKKIDAVVGIPFLVNKEFYQLNELKKTSIFSGASAAIGSVMYSLITGNDISIFIGPLAITTGLISGVLASAIDKNTEAKYNLALVKHIQKNASTLEFDINTAMDYSNRLQEQLEKKNVYVNNKYQNKEEVIIQHLTIAKKNLSVIYETLEEIRKEKK